MEPESSSPHSQVPATCLYPEPARSSPYPHIPLPEDPAKFILPSTLRTSKWFLSLRFPHQNPVYASTFSHTLYVSRPSHSSRFDHPTILGDQYRSLSSLLRSFFHSPVTSSLLGPNILLNTLFTDTLSLLSSLNVNDQVSHPYKTTGKIIVLYFLIFKF